jgi:hypothetical protein
MANFERRLDRASVPTSKRSEYHKWVRLYLYFCQKFDYPAKSYSIDQRHHAATAVRLLVRPDPKDPSLYLQLSSSRLSCPQPGDEQLVCRSERQRLD